MKNKDKNYSVIILTHAPDDELIVSLDKLLKQSIMPQKIIIYNTEKNLFYKNIIKTSKLDEILNSNKSLFDIVHINEADFDHGKTRNDAIKYVDSNYALFLTDDAVAYDNKLCQNLLESFDLYSDNDGDVAASYAKQVAKDNSRLSERYVREFNYPDFDIIKTKSKENALGIKNYFFSNVCAMYDCNIFDKLGKFEENIILNEDTFFAYNAINNGYKIVYSSKAIVYHSHNYTFYQQFSRNFDIGVSQSEKNHIFDSIPTAKEGKKFVKYISFRLIKGFHFIEFFRFIIECIYRYLGFKKGYNHKNLSIDKCIKYATNKNYFIKRKYGNY